FSPDRMIYGILLALHSLTRWLVLSGLLVSIVRSGRGWAGGSAFTRADNAFRHWTTTAAHVQLVLGVWLYFVSPITAFFMNNFSEAVHVRDVRFFGMEHSLIMTVAVVLVTIGSARA